MIKPISYLMLSFSLVCFAGPNGDLQSLSREFWQWRITTQPATPDDVLRVDRPDGWRPDYSQKALASMRSRYTEFKRTLERIPKAGWTRSDSVDYLCLRSMIERVNWELNVLRVPHRNPDFYLHQTLGAVYEALVLHTPMTEKRIENIILRLESIPGTLGHARENLTEPSAPFARIALEKLDGIGPTLMRLETALLKVTDQKAIPALHSAISEAIPALEAYRTWLTSALPDMETRFSCGRQAYTYFLKNIALIHHAPETLLDQGRQAFDRAIAFEAFEKERNAGRPEPELFAMAEEQVIQAKADEAAMRRFLEVHDIMSIPEEIPHYYSVSRPDHVAALLFMGVDVDLGSAERRNQDAARYIPEPSPDLPYFYRTMAQDPRPIMVHEGIPGHFFQLMRSRRHENPLRRHFIDCGPIEGIGFYVEELMLQFGLFDNKPRSREIIYNFMRLRALRVEVDIQLALGHFSIEEAGRFLAESVPMDEETAVAEAGFFAYNPGQAIMYQIGKIQILNFLCDARIQAGDRFSLRNFHDALMVNGNVPIALQRWETLGLRDEIESFFTEGDGDG